MLSLGIILLLLDVLLLGTGILATIGWILIAVGVILIILGALNRSVGPRRYYYCPPADRAPAVLGPGSCCVTLRSRADCSSDSEMRCRDQGVGLGGSP